MMAAQTSIYAHLGGTTPASQASRCSRRARAEARAAERNPEGPPLRLDREGGVRRALQSTSEAELNAFVALLQKEVDDLEAWAKRRPRSAQTDGATIRRTLEFLRRFGRMSVMDFSIVPIEDRPSLVKILALEHRWCYAAAGTTRTAFKNATGRTGAR